MLGLKVQDMLGNLEYDTLHYTVMADGQGPYPTTLMMLDIAALQRMYGADYDFNATDTVYRWDKLTGEKFVNGVSQGRPASNVVLETVWDGGGIDTYDFSDRFGGNTIDLRPGHWANSVANA